MIVGGVVAQQVTDVNAEHPLNAEPPIVVTEAGNSILVREVQLMNAQGPMVKRPLPKFTSDNAVQPSKACRLIFVTLSGMVMLVRLVQFWKAFRSIDVMLLGNVTDVTGQRLNA